jgi:serine/threonine protein kinase
MAANLPARYQLEIRLGRDHDIEEWLATDLTLDRPVLVRMLGPDVGPERRRQFLADVRALASVSHPHLLEVYGAGTDGEHTWMVGEWTGGVTIADRLEAGTPMPAHEFLPNGAGLAEALAELHAAGIVHGSIGPDAVSFSAAHPAKLKSFARPTAERTPERDVADLAGTLEAAVTGNLGDGPPPSQLTDQIDRSVDEALADARAGRLGAGELADRLRAAPTVRADRRAGRWSWRGMVGVGAVGLVALVITLFGPFSSSDRDPPFALPDPPTTTVTTTSTTTTTLPELRIIIVDVLDPSADGERNAELPNLTDGDPATAWRTERYFAPIGLIKPGVGVTFVLDQPPGRLDFEASGGTRYEVRWAQTLPGALEGWEVVLSGVVPGDTGATIGRVAVELPMRDAGFWLLWLTDLPRQGQSDEDPPRDFYYTFVYEVRFSR